MHFHLKDCINIQFHCSYHLKYQFVCKYMKKITMEIWTEFGLNLELKVGCIKEKIFSEKLNDSILVKFLIIQMNF